MSLLADETVSSFEIENMQSDNEEPEGLGGWSGVGGAGEGGLRFISADADMCERHHGSASELTVQLTGQVSVPLLFVLGRFSLCAPHCTCRDLYMCLSPFISPSLPLPWFAPCSLESDCLDINYIVASNCLPQQATQERQTRHCFQQCLTP